MAKDKSRQMDWRGLEIIADEFTGSVNGTVSAATTTTVGGVKQGAAVANAPDPITNVHFNALLTSLRAAGVIAT